MRQRALVSFLALFIGGSQLRTSIFPGPDGCFRAEKLGIAVRVLVAVLALTEAHAFTVVALQRLALPGVIARSAVVQHHDVARDSFAVGLRSSVINLRHFGRCGLILIVFTGFCVRGACLLSVLIHPGVFVVGVLCGKTPLIEQLKLAGHLSRKLGETPKLVPITAVNLDQFVRLLLIMLITQICLYVLSQVILFCALYRRATDGGSLSN